MDPHGLIEHLARARSHLASCVLCGHGFMFAQVPLVITGKVITLEMGPGYQKAKNTIGPDLKSGRSLDPKISRSLAQDVVQCISRLSNSTD